MNATEAHKKSRKQPVRREPVTRVIVVPGTPMNPFRIEARAKAIEAIMSKINSD